MRWIRGGLIGLGAALIALAILTAFWPISVATPYLGFGGGGHWYSPSHQPPTPCGSALLPEDNAAIRADQNVSNTPYNLGHTVTSAERDCAASRHDHMVTGWVSLAGGPIVAGAGIFLVRPKAHLI